MKETPKITWFNNGEKSKEELDNLKLNRFNIKNYKIDDELSLDNFYVFKILDLDNNSTTGYYGMCINKEFAKTVQENLDKWKAQRK